MSLNKGPATKGEHALDLLTHTSLLVVLLLTKDKKSTMQIAFIGLTIIALGIQSFYLKNQLKYLSSGVFSEPYKNRLASLSTFAIIGILIVGVTVTITGMSSTFGSKDRNGSSGSNQTNSEPILTNPIKNKNTGDESSEIYYCVVCGGKCNNISQENIYMGHHVEVSGIKSSDIVCGIKCDLNLRRRIERAIDREQHDPNSYRDPDIKMPTLPRQ